MSASVANSGYGAIFYTGDSASPTGYTAVLEVVSISKKDFDVPAIDVTHLLSPNATGEMIPGIIKPGSIDLSGNFTGVASQLAFITLARAQTIFPYKLTAPMQRGTQTLTQTGTCFVSSFESGPFESDKKVDFKVTLQITGTSTPVVA